MIVAVLAVVFVVGRNGRRKEIQPIFGSRCAILSAELVVNSIQMTVITREAATLGVFFVSRNGGGKGLDFWGEDVLRDGDADAIDTFRVRRAGFAIVKRR